MSKTTEAIMQAASSYSDVVEGQSCSQTSFKRKNKAFLYIGEQGGRHKAMFKLSQSMSEAQRLADLHPEDFQIGSGGWVTTRFSNDEPIKAGIWKKWLDESYSLCA